MSTNYKEIEEEKLMDMYAKVNAEYLNLQEGEETDTSHTKDIKKQHDEMLNELYERGLAYIREEGITDGSEFVARASNILNYLVNLTE